MKSASWLCGIAGVSVRLNPLVQIHPLQDPAFFTHLQDCDSSFFNFPFGEHQNLRLNMYRFKQTYAYANVFVAENARILISTVE